jgi:redox-sensitive bicupin YhaK (pirin superfamily)
VIAGRLGDAAPPAPPPDSWASDPNSDLALWTIRMQPGAQWTLPPARAGSNRTLYVFGGRGVRIEGVAVVRGNAVRLVPDQPAMIESADEASDMLLLQGRPIGEPVVQHGPFVMNTHDEIRQAMTDYQRTRFGGWPFDDEAPVHPREATRFARHADGREEKASGESG